MALLAVTFALVWRGRLRLRRFKRLIVQNHRAADGRAWTGGPESIFTVGSQLAIDPTGTLDQLKALGVDRVHVSLPWGSIAPDPQSHTRPTFDATDPAAYPAGVWAVTTRSSVNWPPGTSGSTWR